jgi:hypothetical protein
MKERRDPACLQQLASKRARIGEKEPKTCTTEAKSAGAAEAGSVAANGRIDPWNGMVAPGG